MGQAAAGVPCTSAQATTTATRCRRQDSKAERCAKNPSSGSQGVRYRRCATPLAGSSGRLLDAAADRTITKGAGVRRMRATCSSWLRKSVLAAAAALVVARPEQDQKGWGAITSLPERDSEEYFRLIRRDYKFRIQPDYVQYTIRILVDPCRNALEAGMYGKDCCNGMNTAGCQHHSSIRAGMDLQIAYFQNAHIPTCVHTEFDGDPNCGTYIEVHRAGEEEILGDVQIDGEDLWSGFRTARVSTYRLCLGDHELWWVVRTRSGPYVQKIEPFFVESPTCAAPPGAIPAPVNPIEFGALP